MAGGCDLNELAKDEVCLQQGGFDAPLSKPTPDELRLQLWLSVTGGSAASEEKTAQIREGAKSRKRHNEPQTRAEFHEASLASQLGAF